MPEPGAGAGRVHGTGRLYLRGGVWWLSYYRRGTEYRRSTGCREAEHARAEAMLDRLVGTHLDGAPRAWRLTATELRLLRGPIVYVLTRGPHTLYIGQSQHGLVRPLASRHHVLGRLALDGREDLAVYPCESAAQARALEAELILRLRPRLNVALLPREGEVYA